MSTPSKSKSNKLVIEVTSDLPTLGALEPWERDAVLPRALELLLDLVQAQEDDAPPEEDQPAQRRPVRSRLDR